MASVAFIDYPKHGYKSWRSYFSRILQRLEVRVDRETLNHLIKLLKRNTYQLYPDAAPAVKRTKERVLKTAVVTTIAHFQFKRAVKPIREHFNFTMTGYEADATKQTQRCTGES